MPTPKPALTHQRLRHLLDYNPETGIFRWRIARRQIKAGTIAGSRQTGGGWRNGYHIKIGIDGRDYMAHRLVWFYVHGTWPQHEIDHINGNGADNRLANLRSATRSQNAMNNRVHRDSRSGLKGVQLVHFWKATIWVNGKEKYLGSFKTAEAAHKAYVQAAKKFFGQFARP